MDLKYLKKSKSELKKILKRKRDKLREEKGTCISKSLKKLGRPLTRSQKMKVARMSISEQKEFLDALHQLREQIDIIDDELLSLLSHRMKIAEKIGLYKKKHIEILEDLAKTFEKYEEDPSEENFKFT
jgi:hypothetical protein